MKFLAHRVPNLPLLLSSNRFGGAAFHTRLTIRPRFCFFCFLDNENSRSLERTVFGGYRGSGREADDGEEVIGCGAGLRDAIHTRLQGPRCRVVGVPLVVQAQLAHM